MKNWKTTALGIAIGILHLMQNGMNLKTAAGATLWALLGAASKDFNVSGQ